MTTNFTPGPWAFVMQSAYGKPQFNAVITGDGSQVGDIKFAFLMHPAECHANAKLMAAAPELLGALNELAELHAEQVFICGQDDEIKVNRVLAKALNAIKKAIQ